MHHLRGVRGDDRKLRSNREDRKVSLPRSVNGCWRGNYGISSCTTAPLTVRTIHLHLQLYHRAFSLSVYGKFCPSPITGLVRSASPFRFSASEPASSSLLVLYSQRQLWLIAETILCFLLFCWVGEQLSTSLSRLRCSTTYITRKGIRWHGAFPFQTQPDCVTD